MSIAETEPLLEQIETAPFRSSRRAPAGVTAAGVAVAAAMLVPAVYLVVRAADVGWSGVAETLLDTRTAGLLARTCLLALAVTASSVAIAVPLAWLTERTDLPARRTWTLLCALPLVIPSYIGGYVFIAMLGPRGLAQGWLSPFGVERLPSIYGFAGAWLTLTLFTYPYVFLTVRAALRGLDPALEDVALGLGRTRAQVFRTIVLPQLHPAIAAGSLLVALYTAHDFGAVSLMRFDTFTRAIYLQYQGSFDRSRAAVLGLVLVALTVVVLAAERRARGHASYFRVGAGASRRPPVVALGRWRWPALLGCASVVIVALGIPVGVICYWLARGVSAGRSVDVAFTAAANSLRVSALAAIVAVVAAWPAAVLSARYPGRLARALERVSFIGYALPGLVVALSLVFVGARYLPAVYQTTPLLLFAYLVLFLPQAAGALRASLLQVPPALEDAARSLGSGRTSVVVRILVPLVRPGILAGAALVFLTTMKELPATLLLAPTGLGTLATEVWTAANAASFARAAVPAILLVVIAAIPLGIMLARGKEIR